MIIVGQADAIVLRDDVVVYGEYRLRVHAHPGNLVALKVLHDAGEQSVPANGHGDIGNGFREAWHVAVCAGTSKQLISKEREKGEWDEGARMEWLPRPAGPESKVHLLKSSLVPHLTLWSPFDAIHKGEGERRKQMANGKWQRKMLHTLRVHSLTRSHSLALARTLLCSAVRHIAHTLSAPAKVQ